MSKIPQHTFSIFFCIAVMVFFLAFASDIHRPSFPSLAAGVLYSGGIHEGSILFVGDIMLGRAVERLVDRQGTTYPFAGTQHLIESADMVMGNFEGTIPVVHTPTPNFAFQFSVRAPFMDVLAAEGFDVLGLANNHAYDFGAEGLANARTVCKAAGMTCVGDPHSIATSSTAVIDVNGTRVGLLAIHATVGMPSMEVVEPVLDDLKEHSELQIVFIHWGTEYAIKHTSVQETFAHALIDDGADAIIGHHPHVIEDVEIYHGKPIFYSLGNFIFDQYFSDGVQKGLTVKMDIGYDKITYTLIPVTSIGTPSQPRLMNVDDQKEFINSLFARSSGVEDVRDGSMLVIAK